MAKKEKKKPAKKKKASGEKKGDKDKESEHSPPLRSHHNYEVNKPPFPPKITAERTKKLNEHEQQQGQEEQQQGQKGQKGQGKSGGGSGSSGGGSEGGGGGGGGDQIKGALQAIVQYVDDSGNVLLDPRLSDLVVSAKRILSEQGGE